MGDYRDLDWEMFTGRMFSKADLDEIYEQGRADALTEMITHIKACENEAYDNVEPLIGSVLMAIRIKAEQLNEKSNGNNDRF